MDNINNSSYNRRIGELKEFTISKTSDDFDYTETLMFLEIFADIIYYQLQYIVPYYVKSSDKSTFARNVGNFLNWILGISTTITVLVIGNFDKLLVVENNEMFLYMKSDFVYSLICLLACVMGATILRIW